MGWMKGRDEGKGGGRRKKVKGGKARWNEEGGGKKGRTEEKEATSSVSQHPTLSLDLIINVMIRPNPASLQKWANSLS